MTDHDLLAENGRLRFRVKELEADVMRLSDAAGAGNTAYNLASARADRARIDALSEAQAYLRNVPSFGDGKWAAAHIEKLKGDQA